jgi:effector-binding domain-containing protein
MRAMADRQVRVLETAARPTLVVACATSWREFPSLWRTLLDEVYAAVRAGGGGSGRQNVMLYKDDAPNVEIGVLAHGPVPLAGRVIASELPGGASAMTTHRGPYAEFDGAHRAVRDWCAARGLVLAGPRWEIYGHWRDDASQPETDVHYLLG